MAAAAGVFVAGGFMEFKSSAVKKSKKTDLDVCNNSGLFFVSHHERVQNPSLHL